MFRKIRKRKRKIADEHENNGEEYAVAATQSQTDDFVDDFLIKTRRLILSGDVDEPLATYVCSYLQLFDTQKLPVFMYINSWGGCMASGYAIIDQMLACRCPIHTIVRGQGHSMAAIIAAFGESGHRYATQNSSLMLHPMILQSQEESINSNKQMIDHMHGDYVAKMRELAKRTKLTHSEFMASVTKTLWMSPRQAIRIGLLDGYGRETWKDRLLGAPMARIPKRRITASYYNCAKNNKSNIAIIKTLVYRMANNHTEREDFFAIAEEQLLWCLSYYVSSLGSSFVTLLYSRVHGTLRHARDKLLKIKRLAPCSHSDIDFESTSYAHKPYDQDMSLMIEDCLARLTIKERYVINQLFMNHATIRSVGTSIGRSDATICNIKQTALTKMRREFVK